MKNQFVTYEIAKRVKELDFNEPCLAYQVEWMEQPAVRGHQYNENNINSEFVRLGNPCIGIPLWQQVIEFVHQLLNKDIKEGEDQVELTFLPNGKCEWNFGFDVITFENKEAGILKALTLIEK